MCSFTRLAVTSCLAGTFFMILPVSEAPAATTEKLLDPCVLVPRPRCPYLQTPVCGQWKYVVRAGKTVRCCAKWGCIMRVK
jgi:hypothetical protein